MVFDVQGSALAPDGINNSMQEDSFLGQYSSTVKNSNQKGPFTLDDQIKVHPQEGTLLLLNKLGAGGKQGRGGAQNKSLLKQ